MQFRKAHPWDGRYALPDHVLAEPPRFGTLTTSYRRRRSIDAPALASPWKTGYAYPSYLKQEPLGRGVFRTKYTPRRTVDTLVPEYLSGLGADDIVPGADNDPIAQFGKEVSAYLMSSVYDLPPEVRKPALRALLDQLDPGLWDRVATKATKLQQERDMGPLEAMEKALASSLSYGLLKEFLALGRSGKAPAAKSMLGLAAYGEEAEVVVLEGFATALGWCGPICRLKQAGSAVKAAGSKAWDGTKWVGGKIGDAASQAGSWAKDGVKWIGRAACKVANHPVGTVAAAAGAAAAGAPPQTGVAGAQVAAAICAPQAEMVPQPAPEPKLPLIPIAIGGVALLLLLR